MPHQEGGQVLLIRQSGQALRRRGDQRGYAGLRAQLYGIDEVLSHEEVEVVRPRRAQATRR